MSMTEATQALLPVTPEIDDALSAALEELDRECRCAQARGEDGKRVGMAVLRKHFGPALLLTNGEFAPLTNSALRARLDASQSHSLPGDVGMREALEKIAAGVEKRMHDGTSVVDDHPDAMEIARAALTPSPCPGDRMREMLVKARRALSCYRCGGDGWVTTMLGEPDECPACHGEDQPTELMREIDAALTPSALSGDAGEGEASRG